MFKNSLRRACVALVSVNLLSLGLPPAAQAGIVTTDEAIAVELRGAQIDAIRAGLARDDVRSRMLELGVEPARVEARLAALTDAELAVLAERMDSLPAGGDLLAIVGVVFLVLLLLEYTGTIDIFKKIP